LTLGCELKLSIETPPPFSRNLRVVFVQTDTAIFLLIKHCASVDLQTKLKNEAWHLSETRVIPCRRMGVQAARDHLAVGGVQLGNK